MKIPQTPAICAALFAAGIAAVALTARPVAENDALDFPTNPLGVFRSPYGEVLAMAMQEPIDTLWHQGQIAQFAPAVVGQDAHPATCPGCRQCDSSAQPAARPSNGKAARLPWNERFRGFLERLDEATTARTNAVPSSRAHDLFIRRQVEDKLRFGYRLDPAHYGNYNSYHFFLTEPQMGTRRILSPEAARLAQETIDYALTATDDPRPSLTAAAAATNVLHLMFADQRIDAPVFTPAQMRHTLSLLDHCIARHIEIHQAWTAAGHDALLSPMRILEMEERFSFIRRIRDAAEPAVIRFESATQSPKSTDD